MKGWAAVARYANGERVPWLVIEDVPDDVKRADVVTLLGSWRDWRAFTPPAGGRVDIIKWPAKSQVSFLEDGGRICRVISWPMLCPSTMRLTVAVPGETHRRLVMAAGRGGVTLSRFVADQLRACVELAP